MISNHPYWAVSLIVDGDGVVHAAADELDLFTSSIHYITNSTGSWTHERLLGGSATGENVTAFWTPTISQDTDGSLSISFQFVDNRYRDEFGIWTQATPTYLIRNRSGDWSAPVEIGQGDAPSVEIRNGVVHFAAQKAFVGDVRCAGERYPLAYRTDATGEWTTDHITRNGVSAQLALAADGLPRILYSGSDYRCSSASSTGPGLIYATATGRNGQFAREEVPGTPFDEAIALRLDADERPHILFFRTRFRANEFGEVWYAFRDKDGWSQYELVLLQARPLSSALDDDGYYHVLARMQGGVVYATNRGGNWESTPIWSSRTVGSGALALDREGRPHVLLSSRGHELFYAVGPGP